MNFDPTWLFVSLVINSIGFGVFIYGKKQSRIPQLLGGIALMIYPYFVESLLGVLLAGAAICAAMYWAIQAGY